MKYIFDLICFIFFWKNHGRRDTIEAGDLGQAVELGHFLLSDPFKYLPENGKLLVIILCHAV